MKEEFNLSEKRNGIAHIYELGEFSLSCKDVKEFIKREDEIIDDYIKGKIDEAELVCRRLKLAGDKLK